MDNDTLGLILTVILSFYNDRGAALKSAAKPRLTARRFPWLLVIFCAAGLVATPRTFAQFWGSKGSEIEKLAPLLDLKAGSTVAEIGAGNGGVAVAAGEEVGPGGHVYATEIDAKRLNQIRAAASKAGLANVTVVESKSDDTRLPANCCDAIYMIGVCHHFTEPLKTDASIFRALRPGGRLVVVDFRPSLLLKPWTPKGVPANRGGHGIPENILEDELTRSAFQVTKVYDHWGNS
jgi:ubiquinone/menaquinone biosynthesis C-methylase UbiE